MTSITEYADSRARSSYAGLELRPCGRRRQRHARSQSVVEGDQVGLPQPVRGVGPRRPRRAPRASTRWSPTSSPPATGPSAASSGTTEVSGATVLGLPVTITRDGISFDERPDARRRRRPDRRRVGGLLGGVTGPVGRCAGRRTRPAQRPPRPGRRRAATTPCSNCSRHRASRSRSSIRSRPSTAVPPSAVGGRSVDHHQLRRRQHPGPHRPPGAHPLRQPAGGEPRPDPVLAPGARQAPRAASTSTASPSLRRACRPWPRRRSSSRRPTSWPRRPTSPAPIDRRRRHDERLDRRRRRIRDRHARSARAGAQPGRRGRRRRRRAGVSPWATPSRPSPSSPCCSARPSSAPVPAVWPTTPSPRVETRCPEGLDHPPVGGRIMTSTRRRVAPLRADDPTTGTPTPSPSSRRRPGDPRRPSGARPPTTTSASGIVATTGPAPQTIDDRSPRRSAALRTGGGSLEPVGADAHGRRRGHRAAGPPVRPPRMGRRVAHPEPVRTGPVPDLRRPVRARAGVPRVVLLLRPLDHRAGEGEPDAVRSRSSRRSNGSARTMVERPSAAGGSPAPSGSGRDTEAHWSRPLRGSMVHRPGLRGRRRQARPPDRGRSSRRSLRASSAIRSTRTDRSGVSSGAARSRPRPARPRHGRGRRRSRREPGRRPGLDCTVDVDEGPAGVRCGSSRELTHRQHRCDACVGVARRHAAHSSRVRTADGAADRASRSSSHRHWSFWSGRASASRSRPSSSAA